MPVFLSAEVLITPPGTTGWQTVDLSAYIPSNATGVIVHAWNTNVSGYYVGARPYGTSLNHITHLSRTHCWLPMFTSSQKIDLYKDYAGIYYYLVGYFTSADSTLFTPILLPRPGTGWYTIDLSSYITEGETAIAAIIYWKHSGTSASYLQGARKYGSSDNRTQGGKANGFIVGMSSDNKIGIYYGEITYQTPLLVGYIKSGGGSFLTNGQDKSPSITGSWQDVYVDANSSGAVFEVVTANYNWGARRKGDTLGIYTQTGSTDHAWAIVGLDSSGYCQIARGYTTQYFYLLGTVTAPPSGPGMPLLMRNYRNRRVS